MLEANRLTRCLLDRLSDRTLVLEDGRATLYPGSYSYAEEKRSGRTPHLAYAAAGGPRP